MGDERTRRRRASRRCWHAAVKEIAAQAQARIPRANLDERDPDFIRERLPLMWLLSSVWFRAEVRGLGNIPDEGPVLLVGNHSGGNMTPDTIVFTLAFNSYFGVERSFFQLAHNLVLSMPGLGMLRKFGTVAASRSNARRRSESGAALLVYPGRRLRGPPAELAAQPRRLRRAQGLHPHGDRRGRPDRPGRLDRRPGDRAVPQPRRGARAAARARPDVPPEGAADLDRAAVGPERRRHARPRAAARQDHRRDAPRDRPARASSAPSRISTRSTTT